MKTGESAWECNEDSNHDESTPSSPLVHVQDPTNTLEVSSTPKSAFSPPLLYLPPGQNHGKPPDRYSKVRYAIT